MTKLSVNVNKLATLRNARGKNNPDVLKTTLQLVKYGVHGITVHPRPDGRHIRVEDVYAIAKAIKVEFNIEGYPNKHFLDLIKAVRPAQCTLVPDPPHVLTSNAGWSITENQALLTETVHTLKQLGVRSSLFIDPYALSTQEIQILKEIGTDRCELYTEAYACHFNTRRHEEVLGQYQYIGSALNAVGIELNAGHDLDLDNLSTFIQAIPTIKEVSIGHALICDALKFGLKETVQRYLNALNAILPTI